MKLLLFSDMHTNFHRDDGRSEIAHLGKYNQDVDVCVVAGDLSIVINNRLQANIEQLCSLFPEVVYVTGNHEYYHSSFRRLDKILRDLEAKLPNFTWLDDQRKTIAGKPFIGSTLWFAKTPEALNQKSWLNDFNHIKDCDPIAFEKYEKTVEFFEANMQKDDIVVTHHLPTYKSISPKFQGSSLNCYFANDLDDMIKDKEPVLWLHGHTHTPCDYMYYSTRIACNPFGYPAENHFFDSLVIEV